MTGLSRRYRNKMKYMIICPTLLRLYPNVGGLSIFWCRNPHADMLQSRTYLMVLADMAEHR